MEFWRKVSKEGREQIMPRNAGIWKQEYEKELMMFEAMSGFDESSGAGRDT